MIPLEDRPHGGVRSQGRVFGQLRKCLEDLRLRPREECGPAPPPRWWWRWLKRLPRRSDAPHGLDLSYLPHPRCDPSCAGLPATGKSLELTSRLLGPAGAHGCQRPGLAVLCYGARAAPAVEPTPRLAGHGPLTAEAAAVAYAGAAPLLVFATRTGLCHRRDLSMQLAFLILHLGA
jgi:hypothetical protein